ncbi:GalNAc(5)-diNAcBac-PP-undecaprenol beta-1,3-glucosyltransferase [Crateriforma conspicua]|uniref:GalNAc(5)-diNAcBac-PP-undecaprenol beta-1,3-glucosyltransferase n=2 Tax=Crateriforma conspicua TaxID=2527996 RepID=A0A5C6FHR3_9PLAN|nr:GalNAc(5)-diNAcBac-PP-undecaprenol beta-1,3-glucosyltransferase [Crateriforma conspicua]
MISVIIPTCHRNDDLAACLERLVPGRQSLSFDHYEVIVSDDGRDSTAESLIADRYPFAQWVKGPQRGPAANRNAGASCANGEWLVFVDDDCVPSSKWLGAYAANTEGSDILEGMTSAIGSQTRFDEECPINESGGALWSCNFAIRRNAFFALGGFNENFPAAAMEDVELNYRVNQMQIARTFISDAVVLHPWRREKDIAFRKQQAQSIAYYVGLHPELRRNYSLFAMVKGLLRYILRSMLPRFRRYRGKGAFRAIRSRIYLIVCTQFALNSGPKN